MKNRMKKKNGVLTKKPVWLAFHMNICKWCAIIITVKQKKNYENKSPFSSCLTYICFRNQNHRMEEDASKTTRLTTHDDRHCPLRKFS